MRTKNEIMKVKGFENQTNNICELQREQPFSGVDTSGKHYGMPVSTTKFLNMLYRFWTANNSTTGLDPDNPFKDVWWVTFSKASLFRILAQEKAEYVRFYLAIPNEGVDNASLALEGIKADGLPVKLNQLLKVAATLTGDDDLDPESSTGKGIMAITGGDPTGDNEEMANGGPGLFGNTRNISSFNELFDDLKTHNILPDEHQFKEFVEAYYKKAQENFK